MTSAMTPKRRKTVRAHAPASKASASKARVSKASAVKTPPPRAAKPKAKPSAATPARGKLEFAQTGKRSDKKAAIVSVAELMAYAYAMEIEASERYAEFADAMEAHNNREVAELFRKLARIEHRHSEQVLETMDWVSPPAAPTGGYRWEGLESPESGEPGELHYLMQPYHALTVARHNEARAEKFFVKVAKTASVVAVRKAAAEMAEEETEHVRLIDDWLARTPKPERDWAFDPDPPMLSD